MTEHSLSFNAAVGQALRKARHAQGWTQATLAYEAGLSPNYVARLERGELGPSLYVATRLARSLNVSVDSFVGEMPTPERRAPPTREDAMRWLAERSSK